MSSFVDDDTRVKALEGIKAALAALEPVAAKSEQPGAALLGLLVQMGFQEVIGRHPEEGSYLFNGISHSCAQLAIQRAQGKDIPRLRMAFIRAFDMGLIAAGALMRSAGRA